MKEEARVPEVAPVLGRVQGAAIADEDEVQTELDTEINIKNMQHILHTTDEEIEQNAIFIKTLREQT